MTLGTTNLSFSALQTEYGGVNPISLSEYYRGGTAGVPSGQTSSYGTIPTSGAISIGVFRGTTKLVSPTLSLSPHSISSSRDANGAALYNSSSAFSRIRVNTNGILYGTGSTSWQASNVNATGSILIDGTEYWNQTQAGSSSGDINLGNWITNGTASDYSCRANIVSGDAPNGSTTFRDGTYGSWLALTSIRDFSVSAFSTNDQPSASISLVFTLQIALSSNLTNILASANMTLSAAATSSSGNPWL